jgi:hypothetical protein
MGVMAEIGQIRWRNSYEFPLVGITLEALVPGLTILAAQTSSGGERSSGC